MTDDEQREPTNETVPYGSAYHLDHAFAQGALRTGAIITLDHAIMAFAEFLEHWNLREIFAEHVDSESRAYLLRCSEGEGELQYVYDELPAIYRERYKSRDFLANWITTVSIVGWKLAQPEFSPLSNTAEELALHLIIGEALSCVEDRAGGAERDEAQAALRELYDEAYEDNDFLDLYDMEDSDEFADRDPTNQMGYDDQRFKSWFVPFGSGVDRAVPHPYVLEPSASDDS